MASPGERAVKGDAGVWLLQLGRAWKTCIRCRYDETGQELLLMALVDLVG